MTLNHTHDPARAAGWPRPTPRAATSRSRTCPSRCSAAPAAASPSAAASRSATRCWTSRALAVGAAARRRRRSMARAPAPPRRSTTSSRSAPACGGRCAMRLFALLKDDAPTRRWPRPCAPAWSRRPRSSSRCPRASATTPTSTPRSTTRSTSGGCSRPDDPITPNFQWIPIAYHGRASTLGVSGQRFHRPMGQAMAPGATRAGLRALRAAGLRARARHLHRPGQRARRADPDRATRSSTSSASACSTTGRRATSSSGRWRRSALSWPRTSRPRVSPWIVTLEALAPYRRPGRGRPATRSRWPTWRARPIARPARIDIRLEVWLESAKARARGQRRRRACRPPASGTSTGASRRWWRTTRWAAAACNAGDLFGSGTISGPGPGEAGAMIELTRGGQKPIALRQRRGARASSKTAMRCCCAAGARSRAMRASASARAGGRCCRQGPEPSAAPTSCGASSRPARSSARAQALPSTVNRPPPPSPWPCTVCAL